MEIGVETAFEAARSQSDVLNIAFREKMGNGMANVTYMEFGVQDALKADMGLLSDLLNIDTRESESIKYLYYYYVKTQCCESLAYYEPTFEW